MISGQLGNFSSVNIMALVKSEVREMKSVNLKRHLPWWAKIGAKLVLSRVLVAYSVWQRLGLFRHGHMDSALYALQVFESHMARSGLQGQLQGKRLLEMGPGDSIATAIIAYAYGARAVLIDVGSFAIGDPRTYGALCKVLRIRGLTPPDLPQSNDVRELLVACGGEYCTEGLASWRTLASDSIDFVFSQAVLEHIRRSEFLDTMRECYRVMRPGAIASHRVDLRDHLGGALNNLRFRESIWESPFFARSGFYTNRIQYRPMLNILVEIGWEITEVSSQSWPDLPTPLEKMAMPFRLLQEDELLVSGFDVVLKKGA